jgi:hypothetical protein
MTLSERADTSADGQNAGSSFGSDERAKGMIALRFPGRGKYKVSARKKTKVTSLPLQEGSRSNGTWSRPVSIVDCRWPRLDSSGPRTCLMVRARPGHTRCLLEAAGSVLSVRIAR